MSDISFSVEMDPIGKARPRFARGRTYTPAKTAAAEKIITVAAIQAMAGRDALTGAVSLEVVAIFPVPPSASRREREARIGRWHTQKPDADNVLKIVADACNGIVFRDDAQVAVASYRGSWGERGRLGITVRELP